MFSKNIIIVCVACVGLCGCAPQQRTQPAAPAATAMPAPSAAAPTAPVPEPTAIDQPQATQPAVPAIDATATAAPATPALAAGASADEPTPEPTTEYAIWGKDVTLDEFIAIALSGKVSVIEWFTPYDRIRITERTGPRYNYKNAAKVDMVKVLEDAGVVIGDEGIPFSFET
jgi:hypothetical protein